ncbi:MAG: hypothetical protein FJX35_01960 [Alphaproteobacteria bacterium]|nr:hypothetical protein [Alphaproteobacteria bacterium]
MAFSLGEFLRGLFSGGGGGEAAVAADPVEYKGYMIVATPRQQGSTWTTEGTISKQFPEGPRESRFIRADAYAEREAAVATSISKAKRIIDEQGDQMFEQQR